MLGAVPELFLFKRSSDMEKGVRQTSGLDVNRGQRDDEDDAEMAANDQEDEWKDRDDGVSQIDPGECQVDVPPYTAPLLT